MLVTALARLAIAVARRMPHRCLARRAGYRSLARAAALHITPAWNHLERAALVLRAIKHCCSRCRGAYRREHCFISFAMRCRTFAISLRAIEHCGTRCAASWHRGGGGGSRLAGAGYDGLGPVPYLCRGRCTLIFFTLAVLQLLQ